MVSLRSTLVLACALSMPVVLAPPEVDAQAATDADAAARQAFEAGSSAYDRGRFTEALTQFEKAYALSPRPKLLFNIGRAADSDGKSERAIEAYEAYLRAFPQADNREFVEGRLARLRAPTAAPPPPAAVAPPPAPVSPVPETQPYVSPPTGQQAQSADPLYQTEVGVAPVPERSIRGFRLYGGLRLGVGGDAEYKVENLVARGVSYDDETLKADLKTTFGMQLGAGYAWRFFGIGGELRVSWYGLENDDFDYDFDEDFEEPTSSAFVDLIVKPRGGYQLASVPLEFYLAVPIGLSVPLYEDAEVYGGPIERGWKPGPTIGVTVGASYFFSDHFGVNAEMGWTASWYEFDFKNAEDVDPPDFTITYSQWTPLLVNAMLAF